MATEMFGMPGFAVRWDPTKADVGAAGDIGYSSGTYEMTATDSTTGAPMNEKGKYVRVWKKQTDSQWKVVADIFNPDAAPAPAAAQKNQKK